MFRMREKVGMKVVRALKRNNDGVSHAALDMLCALMQVCGQHCFIQTWRLTLPRVPEIFWDYFFSWKSTGNSQNLLEIVCDHLSLVCPTVPSHQ